MILYLLIFFLVCLIYKYQAKAYLIIPVILVLFSWIRPDNVGSDFAGYCELIENGRYDIKFSTVVDWYLNSDYSSSIIGTEVREFGFSFLITFLQFLFNDSRTVITVIIALTYMFYILGLKEIFKDDYKSINLAVFIAFSIFILYAPFNTLRQGLSCSIVFLATTMYFRRKWIPALILLLLSTTIHFSACVIVPIVIFSRFVILKTRLSVIILLIAAVLAVLRINIVEHTFSAMMDFGGRDITSGWNEKDLIFNSYMNVLQFLMNLFSIYIFFLFSKDTDNKDSLFIKIWFVGLLAYILLIASPNVGRISEFLYVFMIIAIPMALKSFRSDNVIILNQKTTVAYQFLMLYCAAWQFFYILRNFYGLQPMF